VGLRIYAINLYPIHGVCEYATPHHEIDDVLVAWGGVAGQVLLLPLPMIALVSDWLFDAPAPHVLSLALTVLGPINLIMIATNLVPVPGLDGERAWRIFPLLRGKWRTAARRLWVRVSRAREVSRASAKALAADAIDRAKRRSKQLD
jgi:Zn-dependent protease